MSWRVLNLIVALGMVVAFSSQARSSDIAQNEATLIEASPCDAYPMSCTEQKDLPLNDELILANEGDPKAQDYVAWLYHAGRGCKKNYEEAAKWWLRSAKQGFKESMSQIAKMYLNGEGVQQDYLEAYYWAEVPSRGLGALDEYASEYTSEYTSHLTLDQKAQIEKKAEGFKPVREMPLYIVTLEKRALDGDIESEKEMSGLYTFDLPGDENDENKWLKLAAERGDTDSQNRLGQSYYYKAVNSKDSKDFEESYFWLSLYQKGLAKGDLRSRQISNQESEAAKHISPQRLAALSKEVDQWQPAKTKPNGRPESLKEIQKRVDGLEADKQSYYLKQHNIRLGEKEIQDDADVSTPDNEHELARTQALADGGDEGAQYALGNYYRTSDRISALKWYLRSANQGFNPAQYAVAILYDTDGPTFNAGESYFWLLLSDKNAPAGAEYGLNYMAEARAKEITPEQKKEFDRKLQDWKPQKEKPSTIDAHVQPLMSGNLIPPKSDTDLKKVTTMAQQGDPTAQYALGLFYQQPLITKDYIAAFKWYRRAAEQGEIRAQEELGKMYYDPHGLAFDPAEAYFWLTLVYQQGRGGVASEWHSIPFLKNEPKELTAEQKSEIDKKIQAWHPTIEEPSKN